MTGITCYEAGCPFANKTTGTCEDRQCIAHPQTEKPEHAQGLDIK